MKYLVMECHTGYAVLLDEEGRFCRAANPGYEVGQTVEDPVLMREEKKKTRHAARRISGLVAAAACFLIFFGFRLLLSELCGNLFLCLSDYQSGDTDGSEPQRNGGGTDRHE